MLNIIHAKFSLLSNVVASGLNDFRPLSEVRGGGERFREGANKQVISSQADSLIKISRIWA
ncbi:hypothetical protein ACJEKX_20860, partial [Escherichia coli]